MSAEFLLPGMPKKSKGKFIVIDGTDGSGKATQVKLLVKRLKKEGRPVETIDFPRYYNNFFGKFIGQCLAGDYGNFLAVSPYFASVLYAADRFESAGQIRKWLAQGEIVIADRYTSSNQIHQAAKIKNFKERKKFLDWLEKMEFEVFKIPRPDAIIYLNVPVKTSQQLLEKKEKSQRRRYLKNGGKDIHESDIKYQQDAKESALALVRKRNNWIRIDCSKNGGLMTKKEIHNLIFNKLKLMV